MANYYTQLSTALRDLTVDQEEQAMKLFEAFSEELEKNDDYPSFKCSAEEGKLWLHSEEACGVDQAVNFVLKLGRELNLKGRFGFAWANTCDKPRYDEFGGGAVVVDFDKNHARFLDTATWLAEHGVK